MRAQARECILKRLQMENSRDFGALLIEAFSLTREYNKIHYDIQSNSINFPGKNDNLKSIIWIIVRISFKTACWEALIPLKTEYFKALSHVYYAKNIAKSSTQKNEAVDEKNRLKMIKAHLQASQSSHEEILRLQRMCRELRVSFKTKTLIRLPIMQ